MRFLLDTNIVGELRKRNGNAGVKEWVSQQDSTELAISVVTVIEIEVGIRRVSRRDSAQAKRLVSWLEHGVLAGFADRIIPVDLPAARQVAPLHVPDRAPQHDALIAGTALSRRLTVVTRNVPDFIRAGVEVVNPWGSDDQEH